MEELAACPAGGVPLGFGRATSSYVLVSFSLLFRYYSIFVFSYAVIIQRSEIQNSEVPPGAAQQADASARLRQVVRCYAVTMSTYPVV